MCIVAWLAIWLSSKVINDDGMKMEATPQVMKQGQRMVMTCLPRRPFQRMQRQSPTVVISLAILCSSIVSCRTSTCRLDKDFVLWQKHHKRRCEVFSSLSRATNNHPDAFRVVCYQSHLTHPCRVVNSPKMQHSAVSNPTRLIFSNFTLRMKDRLL